MDSTNSFETLAQATHATETAAGALPVCLACGETPVAATRSECPYCGTALPRPETAAQGVVWHAMGTD